MAGTSKSPESNENSDTAEVTEAAENKSESEIEASESSDESPVIIDAEAEDVTEDAAVSEVEDDQNEPGDDASSNEPEPEATPVAPAPAEEPSSSGAPVLALLFGGLIAGAIGYFGATLAPQPAFDDSALSGGISQNAEALEALATDIAALQNAPAPELPDIDAALAEINQSVDALATNVDRIQAGMDEARAELEKQSLDLDARILALETAVPAATALSTDDELAALRARISEMTEDARARLADARSEADQISKAAEAARLAAEAEAAEAKAVAEAREAELQEIARRRETLIDVKAAVESGASYSELIEGLEGVPEILAKHADTGVPTVQELRSGFPEMARAALAQSNIVPENASATERVAAFFKRRTNARSLTPQAGDGPDAILSRAEAALGDGDVLTALSELDGLPGSSKAALSGWLESANVRLSALAAIDQLFATN